MAARWYERLRRTSSTWPARFDAWLAYVVAAVSAVVAIFWIVELVVNRGRGLDASDESFYLLAAQFPHSSSAAATGFDSFIAPIWWLSFNSIGRFRVAGVLMLIAAVAAVSIQLGRALSRATQWSSRGAALCIGAGLASLSFTFYLLWLPTPSYNLQVLVIGLVVAGLTS